MRRHKEDLVPVKDTIQKAAPFTFIINELARALIAPTPFAPLNALVLSIFFAVFLDVIVVIKAMLFDY